MVQIKTCNKTTVQRASPSVAPTGLLLRVLPAVHYFGTSPATAVTGTATSVPTRTGRYVWEINRACCLKQFFRHSCILLHYFICAVTNAIALVLS